MKRRAKQPGLQPKLRLDPPPTRVPDGKQEGLTQALMELLVNAAQKATEHANAESTGRKK
jgi:hypothetical protein